LRLGGPVFIDHNDPEQFAKAHVDKGYRAAFVPNGLFATQTDRIRAYRDALAKRDVIFAEVGAWCNPLSKDKKTAKEAFDHIVERLTLADELGARTCVNVIGSWHPSHWYGPASTNFTKVFFDCAVEIYRNVIDAVKPKYTKMSFELMPYCFLDSAGEYLRFLKALDRKEAAVHFDPANMINCPRLFFDNAAFFKDAIKLLGKQIVSIHLKDLVLHADPPAVHFEEVPIGTGGLRYPELLKNLAALPVDMPVMLEHLSDENIYDFAAGNLRRFAGEAGVEF